MVLSAQAVGRSTLLDSQWPETFSHMATRNWSPVTVDLKSDLTLMVSFMDSNLTRTSNNAVKHFLLSSSEDWVRDWCVEMANQMESRTLTREGVDNTEFIRELTASTSTTVAAIANLPWSENKPDDIYPICFILRML